MKRLIILLLLVASNAFGAFGFYHTVTVQSGQVPTTQTDFAVLINTTDTSMKSTGNGGHVQSASGFDIRPYSDSGFTSALTYELERYNATTGEVVMWVKVPSLSDGYVIYLGYGDAALTTDGSSTSTWDSNYAGVWHLKDGTTLTLTDSTSNAASLANISSVGAAAGKVDGASGTYNGTSKYLKSNATINLTGTNKVTFSAWVNINSYTNSAFSCLGQFATTDWFSDNNSFTNTPNDSSAWFVGARGNGVLRNGGTFTRPATGVHYIVSTYDTTIGTSLNVKAYVDGVSQTITQGFSNDLASHAFGTYTLWLMTNGGNTAFVDAAYLDEVRLSKVVRSADWITTEYNNQSAPGTFYSFGSELVPGANNSSAFFFFFGLMERWFTWHPFLNESH